MGNKPIFTGVGSGGLGEWAPRKNSEIIDIRQLLSVGRKQLKYLLPLIPEVGPSIM